MNEEVSNESPSTGFMEKSSDQPRSSSAAFLSDKDLNRNPINRAVVNRDGRRKEVLFI